jgi:hypothetical protein
MIIHLWTGSIVCPTHGHGILVLYLERFGYCLRTSNILAGRTIMSPLWDIRVLHSVMMTKVANWILQRVHELLRDILGSSLHRSSYFIIMIHSTQIGFGSVAF